MVTSSRPRLEFYYQDLNFSCLGRKKKSNHGALTQIGAVVKQIHVEMLMLEPAQFAVSRGTPQSPWQLSCKTPI